MVSEPIQNGEKKEFRDEKGRFTKDYPGGPGRPKGSFSIKERVRQWLDENPDDMKLFVEHFVKKNRELAWQMIEGRPKEEFSGEIRIPQPIVDVHQDASIPANS